VKLWSGTRHLAAWWFNNDPIRAYTEIGGFRLPVHSCPGAWRLAGAWRVTANDCVKSPLHGRIGHMENDVFHTSSIKHNVTVFDVLWRAMPWTLLTPPCSWGIHVVTVQRRGRLEQPTGVNYFTRSHRHTCRTTNSLKTTRVRWLFDDSVTLLASLKPSRSQGACPYIVDSFVSRRQAESCIIRLRHGMNVTWIQHLE